MKSLRLSGVRAFSGLLASRRAYSAAGGGMIELYKAKVATGEVAYDEVQFQVVKHLEKVQKAILNERESHEHASGDSKRLRGVYLCGTVGIGKTMIMDLFFETCSSKSKRRVHFHHFMLDVHRRIHEHKKKLIDQYGRDRHINLSSERDAIAAIAKEIAAESRVLCFDEFHVTDIADAMVMTKLFGELWQSGTLLISTSNRHPDELYENGLNRSYFLPFIEMLKKQCYTISMSSVHDYRMKATSDSSLFFTPLNEVSKKDLYDAFLASDTGSVVKINLPVMMGRHVPVLSRGKSCYMTFKSLCEDNRGPADYHAICKQFDNIYLEGVRQISLREHNVVRRLIMLIDVVYDAGVRFVWSGAVEPRELFTDMFKNDASNVQVVVETDDLTPFDANVAVEKNNSTLASRPSEVRHISHHLPSSEPVPPILSKQSLTDNSTLPFKIMKGESAAFRDLEFAVKRAISRLIEMGGKEYAGAGRKR